MTDTDDILDPTVSAISSVLYKNVVEAGAIDIHSISATWLDKTGERLTLRISKTDVRA